MRFLIILKNSDYAFHFPDKGVNDVVKISGMRSLTAFTVCMWMSSSDNEGSPFGYAVSSEYNELLIYYERYFQLVIGGEERLGIPYCAKVMQKKFDANERNFFSSETSKNFRRKLESLFFPLMWNFTWLREAIIRFPFFGKMGQ